MPTTPARRLRDTENIESKREIGRKANEDKYTEFKLGCDNGDANACTSLGEWFALMRHDFHSAARLYTPACVEQKHPQACLNLGLILAEGSGGVTPSLSRAITVLGISCEQENADACAEVARLLLREAVVGTPPPPTPNTTESTATTTNTNSSSSSSSSSSFTISPDSISKIQLAHSYLQRGCISGDSVPHAKCCGMLGSMYLTNKRRFGNYVPNPSSPQEVLHVLERGCRGEQPGACMKLSSLYRYGNTNPEFVTIEPNAEKANGYHKQALLWSGMTEKQAEQTIVKAEQQRGMRMMKK